MQRPLHIFGYGSLVWRPAFPHSWSAPALLRGWARRFYQGSPDHRGTPEAPGRVVTVLRAAGEVVGGRVYRVDDAHRERVLEELDVREVAGYERDRVRVELADGTGGALDDVLVYHATAGNPSWLGEATPDAIAATVVERVGPSGPNTEYVLRLDEALRQTGLADPHVSAVAEAVRRRLGE